MAKEEKVVQAQEEQVEELAKEQGMTKEEFLAKAQEEQKPKKSKKKETKPKQQKQTKKTTGGRKKKEKKIVGVKDLEAEFKMPGKTIRRHLRRMEENKKPRGPEPYQWLEDDKDLKAIREKLAEVAKRSKVANG